MDENEIVETVDEPVGTTQPVANATQEKVVAQTRPSDSIRNNVQYYLRNPEKYEEFSSLMGELKAKDPATQALLEINKYKLDSARKDAMIELKLEKDEMRFIHGSTQEEILENAKAFAEYKASLRGKVSIENEDNATSSFDKLPVYNTRQTPKQKLEDLEDWFRNNDQVKF